MISAWVHVLWQSEQAFISLEVLLDCMRNRSGKCLLKAAMANTVDFNWKRLEWAINTFQLLSVQSSISFFKFYLL